MNKPPGRVRRKTHRFCALRGAFRGRRASRPARAEPRSPDLRDIARQTYALRSALLCSPPRDQPTARFGLWFTLRAKGTFADGTGFQFNLMGQ